MGHGPERQYYSWAHQKETQAMPTGLNPSMHACMPHVQNLLVFLDELYVLHLLYRLKNKIVFFHLATSGNIWWQNLFCKYKRKAQRRNESGHW
jgi:hypothetical protein